VRSLYEADDGALWVSMNTAELNRRDPVTGEFTHASGNMWVGAQHGLNRLDANGREFIRFSAIRARALLTTGVRGSTRDRSKQ
jgi:hypothetical protein